jgi:hypothetical protein
VCKIISDCLQHLPEGYYEVAVAKKPQGETQFSVVTATFTACPNESSLTYKAS